MPLSGDIVDAPVLDLRDAMASGRLTALEVADAFLARIAEREPEIGAFAFIDPDRIRAEARARDAEKAAGHPVGPLHGVPVAIKDIIDVGAIPGENGTVLDAGRVPERDAVAVQRLRAAGAVILGKAVTTELATMHPGKTRNPRHPAHTPGGSSSGSAAAVAAGMAPLALGTQTNGSVIRPASFCGVVGFKPTFGLIPRTGALMQARRLDTIGVFARSLEGAALLAEVLAGRDDGDLDSLAEPVPHLLEAARTSDSGPLSLAFVRTPAWPQADPGTAPAFEALAARLGATEAELPELFERAIPAHATLNFTDIAYNYAPYHARGADRLSDWMRDAIARGRGMPATDYAEALDLRDVLHAELLPILDRHDAILTPSAPGEAPEGLGATGKPVFNTLWSFCGVPAISLPLLSGPSGLPLGVQLVGRRGDDAALVRTAARVMRALA